MCRVTNCRHNCSWIGGIFTESRFYLSHAKAETFLWSVLHFQTVHCVNLKSYLPICKY